MKALISNIKDTLAQCIANDYLDDILKEIEDEIVADVVASSSIITNGIYNHYDIKLAIGRVLMKKLNIKH